MQIPTIEVNLPVSFSIFSAAAQHPLLLLLLQPDRTEPGLALTLKLKLRPIRLRLLLQLTVVDLQSDTFIWL